MILRISWQYGVNTILTMKLFKNFPKIDSHFHSTFYNPIYERIAKENNLRFININTNASVFPSMEVQETIALAYISKSSQHFSYIASFEMDGWENEGWYDTTLARIENSIKKGALGVKVWKNIGMEIKKMTNNSFLMIDDPFFDPLFNYLSENKIPLLAHLGEPKNCWLPLNKMTSNRNKTYYRNNPEFHAYLHPNIPHYDAQIEARNNVLKKFPNLIFVGAHLGSLEWSYEALSLHFDKYPNFYVDLSSRLGHLQLQSQKRYDDVRDFFIKYAHRILYGTDAYDNPKKLTSSLHNDWSYLSTNRNCESTEIGSTFRGIDLPENVLYKIYYENSMKVYHRLNHRVGKSDVYIL